MNLMQLLSLAVFAIFVENAVLVRFLGVDTLLGASGKMRTALSMGLVVTVVMGLAGLCTWVVNTFLLIHFGLDGFLQTVAFVLIIVALSQCMALCLKKVFPSLHALLKGHLPLIATNCAILGFALLGVRKDCSLPETCAYGIFSGLGFALALVLFASVQERLELSECPKAFEGFPIALVTAGLLAMIFMGFSGLTLPLG